MACDLGLFADDGCGPDDLPLEQVASLTTTSALAFLESARGVDGASEQVPMDSVEMTWDITVD